MTPQVFSPATSSFLVIGHRGAQGSYLGNTWESLAHAVSLGCKAIEIDVWSSKDGIPFLHHDRHLTLTSKPDCAICDLTAGEIDELRLEGKYEIPRLETVLRLISGKVAVNVEIKDRTSLEGTLDLLREVCRWGKYSPTSFLLSSFDHKALLRAKELFPELPRGALMHCLPLNNVDLVKPIEPFSVNVGYELVDEELIQKSREQGYKMYVYTVNTEIEYLHVRQLGIDGMFSDFPERYLKR